MEGSNANRGDLRTSVIGQAAGGEHNRQPDGSPDRVCTEPRLSGPREWVFEDEGYSGPTGSPGWSGRDLAAEGQIEAVLVHAPDRLSRKYAYQILLIEELARHGVDTIF